MPTTKVYFEDEPYENKRDEEALAQAQRYMRGELAYDQLSPMAEIYADIAELGLDDTLFEGVAAGADIHSSL